MNLFNSKSFSELQSLRLNRGRSQRLLSNVKRCYFTQTEKPFKKCNYDGVFIIRYPPAKPKIKSGDHAAINGGSWLILPMASNRLEVRTYVTPMISATTTPLRAPRRPPESANGTASMAMTKVMSGK